MELLALFDKDGNPTGKSIVRGDKSVVLSVNEFVAIVVIFIENDMGEYLIQKTSKRKGGKYSSTGGHVDFGESPLECIKREVKEELGVDLEEDFIEQYGYMSVGNVLRYIYYINKNIDINDIILQEEEVESVKYMKADEFHQLIKDEKVLPTHGLLFNELLKRKK